MEITVQQLKAKLDSNEDFHLIDVREPYEYEEANIGGQLMPLGELMDFLDEMEDWKEEEIVVMCRSGNRSGKAQVFLETNGFENVLNLKGGMLAWQNEIEG
ncbi:rhodanese-like domain-containing protein [Membranihabitans maritimus]|uniref:rhodanese-like domain-containing protein n=1 Tax=Membranihabitans maritimus TaxID=2904244 RepID=UPI001F19ECAD|nr:rhodanese-like domain-containing protein [Membranihabitans maritimus]